MCCISPFLALVAFIFILFSGTSGQGATLGRKAEYIDGSTSAATPNAVIQLNVAVGSGGTVLIGPGATAASDGKPLRYYWACRLGQFQSLSGTNNYVRYQVPVVSATAVDQIYIWIGSTGGTAKEVMISVTITGALVINPSNLSATVIQGSNAANQTFSVNGSGSSALSYSITDNASWLNVSGSPGNTNGGSHSHDVTFSTSGLSPGNYSGQIYVTPQGMAATTINVSLVVNARTPASLSLGSSIVTAPNPIQQGSTVTVSGTVVNTGGSTFTGDLLAQLLTSGGSYVSSLGETYSTTVPENGQRTFSLTTGVAVGSAPGSYQVKIWYRPSGGSYVPLPTGAYSNPVNVSIESTAASKPVSRITSPSDGMTVTNPTITVMGTSTVASGTISFAWVNLNGTGYNQVGTSTNWSTNLTLQPGVNTIQSKCRANSINSADAVITVIYQPQPNLEVGYTSNVPNNGQMTFVNPDVEHNGTRKGGDVFSLYNSGAGPLSISSITSSNPDEFTVFSGYPDLPPDGGTNGYISFDPATTGWRSSQITIYSNDPDTNPFTFMVWGRGIEAPPKPDLRDAGSSWHKLSVVSANSGDLLTIQGRMENGGRVSASDVRLAFFASTDSIIDSSDRFIGWNIFPGSIAPGATASNNISLVLPSDLPSGEYYIGWLLDNAWQIDEENELNNSAVIAFPKLTIGGPPSIGLTVTSPSLNTNLLPGQQVSLQWTSTALPQDTALEIWLSDGSTWTKLLASTSNDGQEVVSVPVSAATGIFGAKFSVQLIGYPMVFDYSDLINIGAMPEILVRNGALAADSELYDTQSTLVGFGNASTGIPVTRSFRIENTGPLVLNIYSVTVPVGYAALGVPSSVPVGGSAVFQVRMLAETPGTYNGNVVIQSDDANEQNFDFPVSGTVAGNVSTALASAVDSAQTLTTAGNASWFYQTVTTHDGMDAVQSGIIGDSQTTSMSAVFTGPAAVSFYWKVSSESTFDFLRVFIDAVDQGGEISGDVDWVQRNLVIPAGSHTLQWTYSKDASISSGNDAGYIDQLVVQPLSPQIVVEQPIGAGLTDGSSTVSFGSVTAGASASLSFTLKNTGDADLTGLIITVDGTNSSDFTVTANPVAPVTGPSGTTTFVVQFAPGAIGVRTAALHIASNDTPRSPFDIALTGTGLVPSLSSITQTLVDGTQSDWSDWGVDGVSEATLTTINGTSSDAFDGAGMLTLTPDISLPLMRASSSSGPLTATSSSGGLTVTRTASLVAGRHALDDDILITNVSGSAQNLNFNVTDNYGADSSTRVHGTSSGDTVVTTADRWFVISDQPTASSISGDPAVMVSWRFIGALPTPSFTNVPQPGDDSFVVDFGNFSLGAGQSVRVTVRRELFDSASLAISGGLPIGLPSITEVGNQTVDEDTATPPIDFNVSDLETASNALVVTASSDNQTRVPDARITITGSGSSRSITVLPAQNQFGLVNITVRVTDADGSFATRTFALTINSVNDAPTISAIADQAILPSATTGPLPFTIGDVETAANSLILTPASNNLTLVPTSNIVLGGIGSLRTVMVTPVAGQTGQATITVSVSDGTATTPISFLLRVSNNNTNLASMVLSSGSLSPNFASATTTYTATIGNTVPSITVTPTVVDANATVRVNGTLVTSGSASSAITLSEGSSPMITILVTAQDGSTKTYSITPTKNPLPTATTLEESSIAGTTATLNGNVNPLGVSTIVTFQYGLTTSYGLIVTAAQSPLSTTTGTAVSAALTGLTPGQTYHYKVVASNSTDSTPGTDMTFTTLSDNPRLSALTLSAGSITFLPDTLSYSTTVANSVTTLTVTPTVLQANATVKVNTVSVASGTPSNSLPLLVGDNTITVTVTAQDGTATRNYTLTVRRKSTDASLASLGLSGITLSPAFMTGITSYTASVPFTTTSTTVTAIAAHLSASVTSGTGVKNLVVGANVLNVVGTAEDGNTQNYSVTVTRAPASSNANLASLTLSAGTLTPEFAAGTFSYTASVASTVGNVTVTPTIQQANATLMIQGTAGTSGQGRVVNLVTGDNAIPIVVTAQDGTTAQAYSITIRQRSMVADLASLSLSGVTLSPVFSSGTTAYTATVPNATTSTTITAAATHASATIAGDGLRSLNIGSNPLTVTVTAEDGNTKDYAVTVVRNPLPVAVTNAATNFAALSATLNGSINAGGVSTSVAFEYGTSTTYGQTVAGVPASVSSSSAASVSAAPTNLIPGTLYHFRVKGTNSTNSTLGDDLTFTTLRNNANLSALALSAGTLAFDPLVATYNVTVANAVNSVTVTPTVADSAATVKVNNVSVVSGETSAAITLVEGINPAIHVLVTAEDGTTKDYVLNYTRAKLPSVSLLAVSEITKRSVKLDATINAQGEPTQVTFEYSRDPAFSTLTSLSPTPALVSGTTNTNLQASLTGLERATSYHWRVRAVSAAGERLVDGASWQTLDSDAYLLSMAPQTFSRSWFFPDTPTLTPGFSSSLLQYSSEVKSYVPEAEYRLKVPSLSAHVYLGSVRQPSSGNSTEMIVGMYYLQTGDNNMEVTVRDTDLGVERTYALTIQRIAGPPIFDLHYYGWPYSTVLPAGSAWTFEGAVAGQSPISFQWKKDGMNLAGANSLQYVIPNLSAAHVGRYMLTAQNALGTTASGTATLGVITTIPPSRVLLLNKGTLSLTASAVGPKGTTVRYEWNRSSSGVLANGGRISGATSKTLAISQMTSADEGIYWCSVSIYNGTTYEAGGGTDGTKVLMAELPEIPAGPLPDAAVSALYSASFPIDATERKTPASYTATGLPPGLKCDPKIGLISGRPTAAKKDKFGAVIPYDVTLTAKNPKGTAIRKTTLRVEPLPEFTVGVFAAPLGRDATLNEGLGGRFDMTVLSTGTFSGKATLGTLSWPFSGVLEGGDQPTATVSIKRKAGQAALTASFSIVSGGRMLQNGVLTDDAVTLNFLGWRQALPVLATDYTGYHTFGILPPPHTDAPRGTGYGSFTVSKTGTLTLAGKTADGESITGGAFVGVVGDIVIYQTLYTTKPKGSLQGSMDIDHLGSSNSENTLDGTVSWSRPASTALLYPNGFGPENYTIVGGGYTAPDAKAGQIVMALPDAPANAALRFDTNSTQVPAFAPDLSIRVRPGSFVERPVVNPAKTTLVITSASGAFAGGFTLVDANPLPVPATPRSITRTVKYQGLIFRENGGWTGAGYFLMPELPSAQWPTATKTPVIPGGIFLGPP